MSHPTDGFTSILNPEVKVYLDALTPPDDPLLDALEAYSAERGFPLVGRESGLWLELLTRMVGGKRVFEFGSGWGYSAFFFARAVGEMGEVIGSEKDPWELEAHARLFEGHPLKPRIDLRQGGALEVFEQTEGPFDVVFIDIDKQGYPAALRAAMGRLHPGALILADNVLWGGKTARPAASDDATTRALQDFNQLVRAEPRLSTLILPACDGLSVSLVVG